MAANRQDAQPTEEQLRRAMQVALDRGDEAAAREIAKRIVGETTPAATKPFTEAARLQSVLPGSIKGRERMIAAAEAERSTAPLPQKSGITSVGKFSDLPKGVARTISFLASLPGEGLNLSREVLFEQMDVPEKDRDHLRAVLPNPFIEKQDIDKALNVLGTNIEGGEDSFFGRSGEFIGGGITGGLGNAIRAASQAGLRGASTSLSRNILASEAALVGSEAGGNFAASLGLPRISGELPGALAPGLLVRNFNRVITGATQSQRAKNSLAAKENVATAEDLAVEISAGIASPNQRAKIIERLFASMPGGMAVMHQFAIRVSQQLEKSLARITTPARGAAGREAAGIGISTALNRRIDNFVERSRKFYRAVERIVPPGQPVATTKFRAKLDDMAEEVPERLKDITSTLRSGRKPISPEVRDALNKIEDGAPLTFQEANALRRVIGAEINQSSSITNPAHGELKAMYGSLSDDIGASLSGRQSAVYDTARREWSKGRDEIDNFIDPVFGRDGRGSKKFEEIFDRALSGDGKKISTLKTVWRALNGQEREVASKALIARMGRVSDEALDVERLNPTFNMAAFLRKWRNPDFVAAKDIIFGAQPQFRKDMDQFVSYIDNFLATNANLANPTQSGPVGLMAATAFLSLAGLGAGATAGVLLSEDDVKGGAAGGVVGALVPIAGVLLAARSSRSAATLMTNPKFVNWLARGTRVPVHKTPEHFGQLAAIANDDPYLAEAVADFMNQYAAYTDPEQLPQIDFQGREVQDE